MRKTPLVMILAIALLVAACSRKGDDSPPERKGDLQVEFKVTDEHNLLTDIIPVQVALYDDTLHQYQIDSKRISTAPDVTQMVEFKDLNARSYFYYLEVKFDFGSELDTACADFPVYIQDGQVRREGLIVLEYGFLGLDCSLQ